MLFLDFSLFLPSSAPGLPLCIDRDVLQWCDVLCGLLVAQVGMSVPRLWGTNTTRAGCTGRRLLKLCRVSVLLLAVVVGSGSLGMTRFLSILLFLSILCWWLYLAFQFFPFNIYKLVKVPWGCLLLYFFSNSFAVCLLIFCLAWVGLLRCYHVTIMRWSLCLMLYIFALFLILSITLV